MAPFYTALALWVGSVLMIITIRSDVTTENVVEGLILPIQLPSISRGIA